MKTPKSKKKVYWAVVDKEGELICEFSSPYIRKTKREVKEIPGFDSVYFNILPVHIIPVKKNKK